MYEKLIKIRIKSDTMNDILSIFDVIKKLIENKNHLSPWTEIKRIWITDYAKRILYLKRRNKGKKRDKGI